MKESRSGMELPLAESSGWSGAPSPPPAFGAPLGVANGGLHRQFSPMPLSHASSDEHDERSPLVEPSSALSDDGRTPLIVVSGSGGGSGSASHARRQKLMSLGRVALGFILNAWYKLLILAVIITLIVLVSVKGFGIFGDILSWFKNHNGWAGWGAFLGMYTGMVALFLPGVVFIMGAGFVFGFWRGLLAVWVGGAIGQALAFLLARYLLQNWVESTIKQRWKAWQYIDKAIEVDGWKLVLIMRFSPIIPYNLLNIAMATTPIPFIQFAVVSAIGIVYECAVFCYFGSMADNISSIMSGDATSAVVDWVLLAISIVMCIAGAVLVSYSLKKSIRRAQTAMSLQELERAAQEDDSAELGVSLDPSYLPALQREGFACSPMEGGTGGTPLLSHNSFAYGGSGGGYRGGSGSISGRLSASFGSGGSGLERGLAGGQALPSPPSPEFELRAVRAIAGAQASISTNNGGGSAKPSSSGGGTGTSLPVLSKAQSSSGSGNLQTQISSSSITVLPKARHSPPPELQEQPGSRRHEHLRRNSASQHTEDDLL